MTDVRRMAEWWRIWVCPECNGFVSELTQAHNETCPNRGRVFAPRDVEVVPLERAEKAEAAARDFAEALVDVTEHRGVVPRVALSRRGVITRDALARHPEYAPGHDFLPGETGERYPSKP